MQSLFNVHKNWLFSFNLRLPNYHGDYGAGFRIQVSRVQNRRVAPKLIHPFILPRSIR